MPPLLDPLTERELEVLRLLAEGTSNAAIAAALVVTVGTVKKHVFIVCGKLGAQNRTQASDHRPPYVFLSSTRPAR